MLILPRKSYASTWVFESSCGGVFEFQCVASGGAHTFKQMQIYPQLQGLCIPLNCWISPTQMVLLLALGRCLSWCFPVNVS